MWLITMNKLEQIKYIEDTIPMFTNHVSKRKIRHDFFKNITTEVQAYLLGFYVADGNINEKRKTFRIHLQIQDSDIVNFYRDIISPDARTFIIPEHITTGRNKKIIHANTSYGIDICSSKICNDLVNLGFGYNKSYSENHIPNISKDLIRHFIRGYFDGDGCITGNYCKAVKYHNERMRMYFQIDFKTRSLAEDIQKEFKLQKLNLNIIYLKRDNMWRLGTSSIYEIKKIFQYLYKDSYFYGMRKFNKFNYYVNTEVSQLIADHRNAQKVNVRNSNNPSKSAEHLIKVNMCAEL